MNDPFGQRERSRYPSTNFGWLLCLLCLSLVLLGNRGLEAQLFSGKPKFMQLFERAPAIPARYQQLPSQAQLIADLNAVSTRVRQLDSRVTLAIPGSPKIHGNLQVEFPNRMRLKAGIMGMSEAGVDAGSNDELFWVWTKMNTPGQPATMYYAKHESFQQSRLQRQLPFEPKWLIDAMGILKIDPRGKHVGPVSDDAGRMRLYSLLAKPGSEPVTRVLLINSVSGIVEQVAIYKRDQLVAWSDASNFTYNPQYDVSMPSRITLHMVQADGTTFKMNIDLKSHAMNSLHGDPKLMWEIPQAKDVPWVDLGR